MLVGRPVSLRWLGDRSPIAGILAAIRFGGKPFCQCESREFDGAQTRQLVSTPIAGETRGWAEGAIPRTGVNVGWQTVNLG